MLDAAQANFQKRQFLLSRAVDMCQQTATGVITGATARTNAGVVNVPLRNVGMLKRIILELSCTIIQSAAETQNLTKWGPANFCSNVTLTDLSNQQRINTSGWHLHAVATAKRQFAYGAAFTNDSPVSIGSNMNVFIATAAVTNVAKTVRVFYEIPVSYSDDDLRGAIYANVVNATFNLQFTINPNFVVGSGGNPVQAVYQSSSAGDLGTLGNVSYTVYQQYLDQIPAGKDGPIVPELDLATAYTLNNTVVNGLSVGQDLPINYANYRSFMSTTVIYDNAGVLNAGTDINSWALQSANYTNILKLDPFMVSLRTRNLISDDFPAGTYYFDFRRRPIITTQFGNMQLVANPSSVGANAQFLVGWEALAYQNQIAQAGSLYAT